MFYRIWELHKEVKRELVEAAANLQQDSSTSSAFVAREQEIHHSAFPRKDIFSASRLTWPLKTSVIPLFNYIIYVCVCMVNPLVPVFFGCVVSVVLKVLTILKVLYFQYAPGSKI